MKYEIGNKVFFKKGVPLYKNSNADYPNGYNDKDRVTYITRKANGAKHPYNTTGDLGWVNEKDIKLYEEPKPEPSKYECEIEVIDVNGLIDYLKEHDNKVIIMNSDDIKKVFNL